MITYYLNNRKVSKNIQPKKTIQINLFLMLANIMLKSGEMFNY